MGKLNIAKDKNGNPTYAINQASWIDAVSLVPNSPFNYVVPSTDYGVAMFSCVDSSGADAGFFAKFNVASGSQIVLPTVSTSMGVAGEPNPYLRGITDVTTIALISGSNCHVTIALYDRYDL